MKRLIILLAAVPILASALKAQSVVGVVDVERCISEYKKAKDQRAALKAEIDEKLNGLREEKRKIEALKDSADIWTAGSNEWLDLQKKIKLGEATIELEGQAFQYQYERKLAEMITKLYEDVKREIKNVAETKGLKLVLMYVNSAPKGRNDSEVTNNIMVRPVMYFDPNSDITAEVVNRLNK
jgi:Skp family chaperone for outer membrane proteins